MTLSTSTSHLVVGSSGNPNPRLVGEVDPMAVNHLIAWPPSFASTITLNIYGILSTRHVSTSMVFLQIFELVPTWISPRPAFQVVRMQSR